MPRLIFKCPHIRGGSAKAAAHLGNYVGYVATREGVEKLKQGQSNDPATEKQRELIAQLLRDFADSQGTLEYEDYQAAPTLGNASAFISRAIEDNLEAIAKKENYIGYIAQRPRVQKLGAHGLFTGSDQTVVLSQVAEEVAQHPGAVWLPIVSLRREDSARLGYDNAERWRELLSSYAPKMADAMKIPWTEFRWYAAYHDEGTHPHVHMVCYSADGRSGFLTKDGIAAIKRDLAREIFRQDLTELYQRQTQRRDDLTAQARETMARLIQEMQTGTLENERIVQLTAHLARELKKAKAKKQYGYLKAPLKVVVDEIVDELARDPRVAEAYDLWYELREDVLRTYKDDLPVRVPLSQQKEFKQIKNAVIREAAALDVLEPAETEMTGDEPPLEDVPAPSDTPGEEPHSEVDDAPSPPEPDSERERQRREHEARRRYRMGWKLLRGEGVRQDVAAARECFERAAHLGNPQAQYQLAKLLLTGNPTDAEQAAAAVGWLTSAAEAGLDYAQYALGKLYRDGGTVEKDALKAVIWFTAAAEQNNSYAAYALGKFFLEPGAKDVPTALHWLQRAAGGGNQYAQYRLGKLYLAGEDVPKDVDKALEYLTDAADQGNQYAQYQLGKLYLLGQDVERDVPAAVLWFKESAAQGNEHAQWYLDHMQDWGALFRCGTTLLHHMGGIFQEQTPLPAMHMGVDSKLKRKIREKKMAMGHKADDHEDQTQEQTM